MIMYHYDTTFSSVCQALFQGFRHINTIFLLPLNIRKSLTRMCINKKRFFVMRSVSVLDDFSASRNNSILNCLILIFTFEFCSKRFAVNELHVGNCRCIFTRFRTKIKNMKLLFRLQPLCLLRRKHNWIPSPGAWRRGFPGALAPHILPHVSQAKLRSLPKANVRCRPFS